MIIILLKLIIETSRDVRQLSPDGDFIKWIFRRSEIVLSFASDKNCTGAFIFNDWYTAAIYLRGIGYWTKFPTAQTRTTYGTCVFRWQLFGPKSFNSLCALLKIYNKNSLFTRAAKYDSSIFNYSQPRDKIKGSKGFENYLTSTSMQGCASFDVR